MQRTDLPVWIYLYFGAVYDSHPRRPDLVGRAVREVVEVGTYSGSVECVGQFNSRTGEGAVTTDLVQCVSVGCLVISVARLIQRLHPSALSSVNQAINRPKKPALMRVQRNAGNVFVTCDLDL